jgi:hypothetical protein
MTTAPSMVVQTHVRCVVPGWNCACQIRVCHDVEQTSSSCVSMCTRLSKVSNPCVANLRSVWEWHLRYSTVLCPSRNRVAGRGVWEEATSPISSPPAYPFRPHARSARRHSCRRPHSKQFLLYQPTAPTVRRPPGTLPPPRALPSQRTSSGPPFVPVWTDLSHSLPSSRMLLQVERWHIGLTNSDQRSQPPDCSITLEDQIHELAKYRHIPTFPPARTRGVDHPRRGSSVLKPPAVQEQRNRRKMTRGAVVRVVRGWWVCSERALGVRCNGSGG